MSCHSSSHVLTCFKQISVSVEDTTPPTVSNCPSNIVQSVELGTPGTSVTFNPPTATDVAGVASIVSNVQSGTFITTGETRQVTYTVTDNSGLTDTSCTFTITVFSGKISLTLYNSFPIQSTVVRTSAASHHQIPCTVFCNPFTTVL